MKRYILPVALFAIAFIITYMGLCYFVPGWKIKLSAEPMVYFVESIRHMALMKTIISFAAGIVVGAIPVLAGKKQDGG